MPTITEVNTSLMLSCYNQSLLGQNVRHFAGDIFMGISKNEELCILIRISVKFVVNGLIDNLSALLRVIAWCR